jgi:hypothetical protein
MIMMTKANSEILDQLKQDEAVQKEVNEIGPTSTEDNLKPKAV